jgi:2,3-dihydroxy-p-cumate/2,3-dihydroxybenzoate 3,4-dioxygenase
MLRYRRLSRVALNVTHLARSREFYAGLPGLEPISTATTAGSTSFRVGADCTVLELAQASSPGLKRFAFEMESQAALDELAAVLARAGVEFSASANAIGMIEPHTSVAVDFHFEPAGAAAATAAPKHAIAGFGHLVLRTPEYRQAVAFWREVLGFRLSDEIDGRISLLRCFPNPFHHSLGIASGKRAMFHHLNFRAGGAAAIDAAAFRLARTGAQLASGPGTHAPTKNRFIYFFDPDGLTLDISTVTELFAEGSERPARLLPDRPESFAVGDTVRHERMFAIGEIQKAGAESG